MAANAQYLDYTPSGGFNSERREQLILEHLRQVKLVAMRIHERLPDSYKLEDLISTGVIGLINAVDNFDPAFQVQLKTYAEVKIRGAILDSLRGLDGIAGHHRIKIKQIQAAITAVQQRTQCRAEESGIAEELGLDIETYRQWLQDVRGVSIGSLDQKCDENSKATLLNYIPDPSIIGPAKQFEKSELERIIKEAIDKLPDAEKLVMDLYYTQELNLREIGSVMNLHLTRISQLKAQATIRLRSYLEVAWPRGRGED